MIERLKSIEAHGFRSFKGNSGDIPLDADVVLIYGPNGSGKTTLMCAIECALTGRVEHLARFESDYPRCLRHWSVDGEAKLSLVYADKNGQAKRSGAIVKNNSTGFRIERTGHGLTEPESQLFSERCYLSQYRLSRLLEVYQATSKDQPESHLVRFARELLGLQLLENLVPC